MKNIKVINIESFTTFNNCKFVIEAEGKGTILLYNDVEGIVYENDKDNQLIKVHEVKDVLDMKYLANRDTFFFQISPNILETFEVHSQYKNIFEVNSESQCVCEWSPNQEVLVVADGAKITLLDTQLTYIGEHLLGDSSFGESSFISVGWGTKETQFKGTAGKLSKIDTATIEIPLDSDCNVQISWRGDSEYFVVSFNEKGKRLFKVFDKYCVLQSTSDRTHHIGRAIAWRPSGNWIAVPIKVNNLQQVGLFEKNGLHFRTITLDLNVTIENLMWSHDSNLLTVETIENDISYLKTYTKSNNHWYLKQTLAFSTKIASYNWAYNDLSLSIHLEDGKFYIYKFCFTTNQCWNKLMSIVGVIDDTRVLLSDFAQGVIPPPYCHNQIDSKCSVNVVGFLKKSDDNLLKIFTMDTQFVITTYTCYSTDDGLQIEQNDSFENDTSEDTLHITRNWMWINNDMMASISGCKIFFWKLHNKKFTLESSKELTHRILDADCFPNGDLVVALSTGQTVFINSEKKSNFLMLPESCDRIEAFTYNDKLHLMSFRQVSGTLYFDDSQLQSNITSFLFFSHFILFTTNDLLWVYDLRTNNIVDKRAIEFMSQIIVGVPTKLIVVLQMTRGNLEAIRPRALTICGVCEEIKSKHFDKAFKMALIDRINLNILIDYNIQQFLEDLELFVDSIKPKAMNLLVLEITDADVTRTMYQQYFADRKDSNNNSEGESKTQVVCRKVLDLLVSKNNSNELTLPIISVLVKMGNIESALRWMWHHSEKTEALDILTNMIDLNQLYMIALGMYNIQMCAFLAERSQMDPKEYLPFLNRLSQYKDQSYRYFQIDLHLKRYDKALAHIAACGDEFLDESFALISKYNLYAIALRIFEDKNDFCEKIAVSFGDFLKMNGKLLEASLMFERGQDLQQAIDMAVAVQDGERCLTLSEQLYGDDIDSIRKIALKMIDQLTSNNKWLEAAEITFKYLEDYELGVKYLIVGDLFLNAIKMCRQWKVPLESVKYAIDKYGQEQLKRIEYYSELFIKMKARLELVRTQKENKTDDFYSLEECDVLSDRSSISSFSKSSNNSLSKKSFRSAKKFRKHERKVFNLKEGSPYEEIAIIDLLFRIVDDVQKIVRPIRDVNMALIDLQMYGVGVKLQEALRNLLKLVESSLEDIWLPEMACMSVEIELQAQITSNQRYKLLDPIKRLKPIFLIKNDWEFEILK